MNFTLKQRKDQGIENIFTNRKLPYLIIGAGIFLRLFHYFYNRSLFGDEAYIATNIIYRGFSGLLQPLEYNQRAPIGYLYAVELTTRLFGYSEFALRFFSLISGLFSLFLFYRFARNYLQPLAVNVGLAVLAFSAPLIYYSSELKQYMTELLVTLALYVLYNFFKEKRDIKYMFAWGFSGAVLIWFSYPSIFIIAGIVLLQTFNQFQKKQFSEFIRTCIAYFFWGASFLINYIFFIKSGSENEFLQDFWVAHFMPVTFSLSSLRWFARMVKQTLDTPLGLDYSILAVIFFCFGSYVLFVYKKDLFFILFIPIILTLVASALHKYPFHKRFLLFLAPILVIFISQGAAYCFEKCKNFNQVLASAFIIFLLLPPILISLFQVFNPSKLNAITRQEIRPVIKYMLQNKKPGDKLIVSKLAFAQFRYYSFLLNIDTENVEKVAYALGDRNPNTGKMLYSKNNYPDFFIYTFWSNDINSIIKSRENNRLWVLFARSKNNEEEKSLQYLDQIGKSMKVFKDEKASVYLYQLK